MLFKVWVYSLANWSLYVRAPHIDAARKYGAQFGSVTEVYAVADIPAITVTCDANGLLV